MNNSSAKFQSTENTEQTESLADVGHVAADFVPTGARRMKNIMMASVCSAVVKALRVEKNVMRKFFAQNQENEQ